MASGGETPVLEFLKVWTPLLPLLPHLLGPIVVVPVRVWSLNQIDQFENYLIEILQTI